MSSKTINILTLDGGGVRGLSALLILQDLLRRVAMLLPNEVVAPSDVFDVVAGTSTGGLIAIMLGKLHMSVAECIEQYHTMAKELFGKISMGGWISRGHWKERYSEERFEKCFRKIAAKYRGDAAVKMVSETGHHDILTTVVARELHSDGSFKPIPAFICSHPCDPELDCLTCDAARATAAAPGYFPIAHLGVPQRFFIDGAFYYNNPSFAVYGHYTDPDMKAPLESTRLRFINIGTGSAPENSKENASLPRRLGRRARKRLTGARNLFRAVKKSIVDAELAYYHLKITARNNSNLEVYRFSSRNDVYKMKLDAHKRLDEIDRLTREYLSDPKVQGELDQVAKALAGEFRMRKSAASPVVSEPQAATTTTTDLTDIVLEGAPIPRRRTSRDLDRLATQGLNIGAPELTDPLTGTTNVPTDEPPEKPTTADEPRSTDLTIKEVHSPLEQDTTSLAGLAIT